MNSITRRELWRLAPLPLAIGCLPLLSRIRAAGRAKQSGLSFSTNVAWDSMGSPDTRPTTWGASGYCDTPIPFTDVPSGERVRILRIYGDYIMWPHGTIPPGTAAGGLTGLLTPSCGQSPYVGPGLGSQGCFFYIQAGCGQEPIRAPFDFNVQEGGLLDADNTMLLRLGLYLNDTGVSIHMETTMVVTFRFETEE